MEEGDRRCPRGLSGCSKFSRKIFTRSSFRPECLGMGGTARVSWWATPMPPCCAMPTPASPLQPPVAAAGRVMSRETFKKKKIIKKKEASIKSLFRNMKGKNVFWVMDCKKRKKKSSAGNLSHCHLPLRKKSRRNKKDDGFVVFIFSSLTDPLGNKHR